MSEPVQIYNVMVPEKYVGRDKVERTNFYQIGTAFPTKDGSGLRVKLAPNVSVSGDMVILPRQKREQADNGAIEADEADEADEIAF